MARINFEDKLWFDPRLELLIKRIGKFEAVGVLCCFWRLAQIYWTDKENPCSLIPEKAFNLAHFPADVLFECEFAERREGGIYAKGAEKNFEWVFKKRESGKKGGLAKAKQVVAGAKQMLSKSKQTLPSSSFSSSFSNNKENTLGSVEPHTDFGFEEELQNNYPKRNGSQRKQQALNTLKRKIKTKEEYAEFCTALRNYRDWCDREGKTGTEFVLQMTTWANNWREWLVLPDNKNNKPKKVLDFT